MKTFSLKVDNYEWSNATQHFLWFSVTFSGYYIQRNVAGFCTFTFV